MTVDRALLERLPKTDLHIHLDGSLRPETIHELAERDDVDLAFDSVDAIRRFFVEDLPERDLVAYLSRFDVTTAVMQTPEALERIAFELVEDAAAENVWYMEVRYAPILSTKRGLSPRQVVDAIERGLRRGQATYPRTRAHQIICGLRHFEPERALRMAALAVEYKDRGVVAFDLAGAERDNPAKWFREAFYLVRDANLNVTVHAGEAYGPESIHQALHWTGAHRIGHGVRLREDPDLMEYVRDHRIPVAQGPAQRRLDRFRMGRQVDQLAHGALPDGDPPVPEQVRQQRDRRRTDALDDLEGRPVEIAVLEGEEPFQQRERTPRPPDEDGFGGRADLRVLGEQVHHLCRQVGPCGQEHPDRGDR